MYEREVAENDRKGKYWAFQTKLRMVDADRQPGWANFIDAWFRPLPEDQEELTNAIRRGIPNPERAGRLLLTVPR
jgi:hypothetical protein